MSRSASILPHRPTSGENSDGYARLPLYTAFLRLYITILLRRTVRLTLRQAMPLINIMMDGNSATVDFQLRELFTALGVPEQYIRCESSCVALTAQ